MLSEKLESNADICPKLSGCDIELGNVMLDMGSDRPGDTTYEASGAILRQIDGLPKGNQYLPVEDAASSQYDYGSTSSWNMSADRGYNSYGGQWRQWNNPAYSAYGNGFKQYGTGGRTHNPQDYARRWLGNGGCIYGDLGHVEVCIPETRSAYQAVAYFHAMLRIVREALDHANAELSDGKRIIVTANNSDGYGQSWGGHTNFAITTECFQNIFERKLHHALFLASYLTSSIVFSGAGKVGSENGKPQVPFEITQRGDFYESLTGIQTTYNRPLVNSRGEHHAGIDSGIARLHCIFFDSTLCHGSSLLKWGATQLVLAMIEQGIVPSGLILDDPLEALTVWNQDPDLRSQAKVISGASYTAVEMQLAILEKVREFVESGRSDLVVPCAGDIMRLWEDTLRKLKTRDFEGLVPRIEWILKRHVLEHAMTRRGLDWDSPEIKHLDHIFSSLEPAEGLYWQYERAGVLEQIASPGEIERAVSFPPDDTRAWLRGRILAYAEADAIDTIDWDRITYRKRTRSNGFWSSSAYYTLDVDNPLTFTRQNCESAFEESSSLEDVLLRLGAKETDYSGRPLVHSAKPLPTLPLALPPHQISQRISAERERETIATTSVRAGSMVSNRGQS